MRSGAVVESASQSPAEFLAGVVLEAWQRDVLSGHGIDPDAAQAILSPQASDGRKTIGDPRISGDGIGVPVDADCPACGWPERIYNTSTRRFGCIRCDYTSNEREA